MRFSVWLFSLFIFLSDVAPVAADPNEIFGAILGQIEGELKRSQQRKQRRRLTPLWRACARGDVHACDQAATFRLNAQARTKLERMREIAVLRPGFERNWHACRNKDVSACSAALNFPGLNDRGRRTLRGWRRRAVGAQRQEARQRTYTNLRYDCLANHTLYACDKALRYTDLDVEERRKLEARRAAILSKQNRRRQATNAARSLFSAQAQRCFAGQLFGCRDAISNPKASAIERQGLMIQRDRVLAEEQRRQQRTIALRRARDVQTECIGRARLAACRELLATPVLGAQDRARVVQQFAKLVAGMTRKAAVRAARRAEQQRFNNLRSSCLDGDVKVACIGATHHRLAAQSDRDRFERKLVELSSIFAWVNQGLAGASHVGDWRLRKVFSENLVLVLSVAGGVSLVGFTVIAVARSRAPPSPIPSEAPPEEPAAATSFVSHFPMTGDLPTDVRLVLRSA